MLPYPIKAPVGVGCHCGLHSAGRLPLPIGSHRARSADEWGLACRKTHGIVLAVPRHPRDQSRMRRPT